eukprot:18023_1
MAIPNGISELKQRMKLLGVSDVDLDKFQDEFDDAEYDIDSIKEDIKHRDQSFLLDFFRENLDGGKEIYDIVKSIMDGQQYEAKKTFIDNMLQYIEKRQDPKMLNNVILYMSGEEFDTDCLLGNIEACCEQFTASACCDNESVQEIMNFVTATFLPLHQFTVEHICNKFKNWVINDINYKTNLNKCKQIFKEHELNGKKILTLTANDIKYLVGNELLGFMSRETLDMSFDEFAMWIKDKANKHALSMKSYDDSATLIYNFPLNNLLQELYINNINGNRFITSYIRQIDIIKQATGWRKDVHQIQATLFKHHVINEEEFKINMHCILRQGNNKTALPKFVIDAIKHKLLEYDAELYLKIKHGHKLDGFCDMVMTMVDEMVQKNQQRIENKNE